MLMKQIIIKYTNWFDKLAPWKQANLVILYENILGLISQKGLLVLTPITIDLITVQNTISKILVTILHTFIILETYIKQSRQKAWK